MDGEGERKLFGPDTNIYVANPAAPWILSGNADSLPLSSPLRDRIEALVSLNERIRGAPNDIFIPEMVFWELDKLSHADDRPATVRQSAWLARKLIVRLQTDYDPQRLFTSEGITLPNGAVVRGIRHNEGQFLKWASNLYEPNRDDRIRWAMRTLVDANPGLESRLRFVSNDEPARFRMKEDGILAEPFLFERVSDPHQKYTGIKRIHVSPSLYGQLRAAQTIRCDQLDIKPADLQPNQLVRVANARSNKSFFYFINLPDRGGILDDVHNYGWVRTQLEEQPWLPHREDAAPVRAFDWSNHADHDALKKAILSCDAITHGDKKKVKKDTAFYTAERMQYWAGRLRKAEEEAANPTPRIPGIASPIYLPINRNIVPIDEQQAALELLANDNIPIVSFEASHGGGKTLLSILVGLLKVQAGVYKGLTYLRPMNTLGETLGTLPGGKPEKLSRYMDPIEDSLKEIFGFYEAPPRREPTILKQIESLRARGCVKYEVASDIGGRTIRREYIIIDEAHLFTRPQVRMLIGRIGKGSKMVFLGDPKQIASYLGSPGMPRFLDEYSNGFVHLPEKLLGERGYAAVSLPREFVLRSPAAALANKL